MPLTMRKGEVGKVFLVTVRAETGAFSLADVASVDLCIGEDAPREMELLDGASDALRYVTVAGDGAVERLCAYDLLVYFKDGRILRTDSDRFSVT